MQSDTPKGPAERAAEIKTPVKVSQMVKAFSGAPTGKFCVLEADGEGEVLFETENEAKAKQIATALNEYASIEQENQAKDRTIGGYEVQVRDLLQELRLKTAMFEGASEGKELLQQENQALKAALNSEMCSEHQTPDPLNCDTCNKVKWLERHAAENQRLREALGETTEALQGFLGDGQIEEEVKNARLAVSKAQQALATDKRGEM